MSYFTSLIAAILSSCFESVDIVSYKKVSEIAFRYKMGKFLLGSFDAVLLILIMLVPITLFFSDTVFEQMSKAIGSPSVILTFLSLGLSRVICLFFWTRAYQEEKVSVLAPYTQTNAILSIVLGFFLFPGTTSLVTLWVALIATLVLWSSNLSKGKFTWNRNCLFLVTAEVAYALQCVFAARLLLQFHPFTVLLGQTIVSLSVSLLLMLVLTKEWTLPQGRRDFGTFLGGMFVSNVTWIANSLIALFLFQSLGVTLTVLLSMVTLAVSLILSYFIYHDVPSKKDVAVSVIILILIGIGLYFSPQLSLG